MNKLLTVCIVSVLGVANSFQSFTGTNHGRRLSLRQAPAAAPHTPLQLSPNGLVDPSFVAGSFAWGLNFYFGFDWLLAPLGTGLDSDFNPAYRTATLVGSLLGGKSFEEALKASNGPITDDEGDRPEMGSRIGSGANVGYVTEVDENETDWLKDREAGLRSSAPIVLQLGVLLAYILVGALAMGITGSLQTGFVLAIPALVYEIGRPSLPTREEALLDSKLDQAVEAFACERILVYGQETIPESVAPVRRDEATNERELVAVFKRDLQNNNNQLQNNSSLDLNDLSDFQIEMRFRELGTGRSEGGFIKGLRLLQEPIGSAKGSKETETAV